LQALPFPHLCLGGGDVSHRCLKKEIGGQNICLFSLDVVFLAT